MVFQIEAKYYGESMEDEKELKKWYNKFAEKYEIHTTHGQFGGLIVKGKLDINKVEIYPKDGEIEKIIPLKNTSELEINLIEINLKSGFSLFEIKTNMNTITMAVNHKMQKY
jgi:hypothetical protein